MKFIKFLFILMLVTTCSFAGPWPVITSISPQGFDGAWKFYITQKLIEVGPSVDVYMPGKYVILTHRHMPGNYVGAAPASAWISSTKTISQTAVELYNNQGKNIPYVEHGGVLSTQECVAYAVSPILPDQWNTTNVDWSVVTVPGGCLSVPPASEWCKITTPELLLDHGTITLKQAEGSMATTQMKVQCTTPSAVTFSMINDDKYVYLDEGKSEITVNDLPLKTKIDLPYGDSIMPVKDLLTGVTTEGLHTGSSILVMMPY